MPVDDAAEDRRAACVAQIVAQLEAIFRALGGAHQPEFLETTLTMAQAKVLYLVAVVGPLHMSEVASRLGVTLSTVSGLVDRLVDATLVERLEDPRDRRQIIVRPSSRGVELVDRFQEFNAASLRRLLEHVPDDDLDTVGRAFAALARAASSAVSQTSPGSSVSPSSPSSPGSSVSPSSPSSPGSSGSAVSQTLPGSAGSAPSDPVASPPNASRSMP